MYLDRSQFFTIQTSQRENNIYEWLTDLRYFMKCKLKGQRQSVFLLHGCLILVLFSVILKLQLLRAEESHSGWQNLDKQNFSDTLTCERTSKTRKGHYLSVALKCPLNSTEAFCAILFELFTIFKMNNLWWAINVRLRQEKTTNLWHEWHFINTRIGYM